MPPTHCILHMKQQSKEDLEEEPNVQAMREEPPTKIPKKKQKSGGNSNGRTGPNLSEKDSIEYVCPICIEEQCKNVKRFRFPHGEFVKDGKVVMDKRWGQTGKYRSATQKARSHHKKVHPHVSMPVAYAITQMKHYKVDPQSVWLSGGCVSPIKRERLENNGGVDMAAVILKAHSDRGLIEHLSKHDSDIGKVQKLYVKVAKPSAN
jgi:hypothetical protein